MKLFDFYYLDCIITLNLTSTLPVDSVRNPYLLRYDPCGLKEIKAIYWMNLNSKVNYTLWLFDYPYQSFFYIKWNWTNWYLINTWTEITTAAHSFSIKMRKIWHQNIHVVHLLIFIPYIYFDTHTYWVNSMDSLKQCITMDS